MNRIYLGLGSNVGDTKKNLSQAIEFLREKILIEEESSLYKTEPVGYAHQDWFMNMVIKGRTDLSPEDLLVFLKEIERKMKRKKTIVNGPRTIDIDILLYEDISLNKENLIIPHPRMTERNFVMVPLNEIAPELTIEGRTIATILKDLEGEKIIKDEKLG